MTQSLWMAFALMLIVEGLIPFISPGRWREAFRRLIQFSDGQIRFVGLSSMILGLALMMLAGWFFA
ncbi:MAG: DUF2065 domain-containing protein [Zoogloeaceae bacterium]|jgi:uncharacterized protein YjeT (DUF2065 family)|nr:DUF2065 domain-containing protein [Zoogloeaceae bacterium]